MGLLILAVCAVVVLSIDNQHTKQHCDKNTAQHRHNVEPWDKRLE